MPMWHEQRGPRRPRSWPFIAGCGWPDARVLFAVINPGGISLPGGRAEGTNKRGAPRTGSSAWPAQENLDGPRAPALLSRPPRVYTRCIAGAALPKGASGFPLGDGLLVWLLSPPALAQAESRAEGAWFRQWGAGQPRGSLCRARMGEPGISVCHPRERVSPPGLSRNPELLYPLHKGTLPELTPSSPGTLLLRSASWGEDD